MSRLHRGARAPPSPRSRRRQGTGAPVMISTAWPAEISAGASAARCRSRARWWPCRSGADLADDLELAAGVQIGCAAGEAIASRSGKGRLVAVGEEGFGESAPGRLQAGEPSAGRERRSGEQIGMLANHAARFGKTDYLGWSRIAQERITGCARKNKSGEAVRPSPDLDMSP